VAKELGSSVSVEAVEAVEAAKGTCREIIDNAKVALAKAAPSAAAAALSAPEELRIRQIVALPDLLVHDHREVADECVSLLRSGKIDESEYRSLLRLNGSMQQETANMNRYNTIAALEKFEAKMFPEKQTAKKVLSSGEDEFSKNMRTAGYRHVSVGNKVKTLTHEQLPPELDLTDATMIEAASAAIPEIDAHADPVLNECNAEKLEEFRDKSLEDSIPKLDVAVGLAPSCATSPTTTFRDHSPTPHSPVLCNAVGQMRTALTDITADISFPKSVTIFSRSADLVNNLDSVR
jgi:hypothetical protein